LIKVGLDAQADEEGLSLRITVGGIGRKQEDVEGESAREYLNLTVSVDHNMMDAHRRPDSPSGLRN
jgi:hypothetical protein